MQVQVRSAALCGAPTGPEFTLTPSVFRTTILERLRLPLDIAEAHCECGGFVDSLGRHRAACPRSGRLRSRAVAPERTLARICREAGAVVRCNVKLVVNRAQRCEYHKLAVFLVGGRE